MGVVQSPLEVGGEVLPGWAQAIGWLIVTFTLVWIPAIMIFMTVKERSLKGANTPTKDWGPALSENRTGRYAEEDMQMAAISSKVAPQDTQPSSAQHTDDNPPSYTFDNQAF